MDGLFLIAALFISSPRRPIITSAKHQGSRDPSKALALMMGEVLLSLQITKLIQFIPRAALVKITFCQCIYTNKFFGANAMIGRSGLTKQAWP